MNFLKQNFSKTTGHDCLLGLALALGVLAVGLLMTCLLGAIRKANRGVRSKTGRQNSSTRNPCVRTIEPPQQEVGLRLTCNG